VYTGWEKIKREKSSLEKIVRSFYIFGDSISRGYYGIGYKKFLQTSCTIHGYDGATLNEVISFATLKKYEKGASIILQGGTNDLLYTYFSTHTNGWSHYITKKKKTESSILSQWEELIVTSIETLLNKKEPSSLSLCTIFLENSQLEDQVTLYNNEIRKIAKRVNASVIEIAYPKSDSSYLPKTPQDLEKDANFIDQNDSLAKQLSKERSLLSTVDGIHLNAEGARVFAHILDNAMKS
jgi:lysophospholipase L1-like esterase